MARMPIGEAPRLREGAEMLRRNHAGDCDRAKIGQRNVGLVDGGGLRHHRRKPRSRHGPAEEHCIVPFRAERARLGSGEERIVGTEQHLVGPEEIEPRRRVAERGAHRLGGPVFAPPLDPVAGKAGSGARLNSGQAVEKARHCRGSRQFWAGRAVRTAAISLSRAAAS